MTSIEVARRVVAEKSAYLFREKKGVPGEYDAKPWMGNKRGWVFLDLFSASALIAVHDQVNAANQAKLAALPLAKAVVVAFRLIK